MNLTIRPLKSAEDGRMLEQVSIAAWGSDSLDAIPSHLSLTVAKENGGVVLLVFDGERPIGFCWGFWAYMESAQKWKCASHQAGVIPEYRGKQIGEKIKWAQRDFVLKKGFDLMTWTFDPLETLNGSLNIRKLGAVCNQYHENLYGDMDDELNRGLPTDRFEVNWWLNSNWVRQRDQTDERKSAIASAYESSMPINGVFQDGKLVKPIALDNSESIAQASRYLRLNVPRNFQALKRADLETAREWRLHTRGLFQTAFDRGYTVIDLLPGDLLCHYIFEHNWQPDS